MSFVTDAQMQQIVAEVHGKAGQTGAPFNPVAAARALGVQVFNTEFTDAAVSGVFREHEGAFEIHVDRTSPQRRARFTAAHELGHYVLHRDDVASVVDSDLNMYRRGPSSESGGGEERRREYQANMFAVEFLMPADKVREAYGVTNDLSRLVRIFDVSEEAMGYRLNELELETLGYELTRTDRPGAGRLATDRVGA